MSWYLTPLSTTFFFFFFPFIGLSLINPHRRKNRNITKNIASFQIAKNTNNVKK